MPGRQSPNIWRFYHSAHFPSRQDSFTRRWHPVCPRLYSPIRRKVRYIWDLSCPKEIARFGQIRTWGDTVIKQNDVQGKDTKDDDSRHCPDNILQDCRSEMYIQEDGTIIKRCSRHLVALIIESFVKLPLTKNSSYSKAPCPKSWLWRPSFISIFI